MSAVAQMLAARGARLVLAGRDAVALAPLAAEVGGRVVTGDAVTLTGRLDGIVNCAGSILLKPAHLTSAGTAGRAHGQTSSRRLRRCAPRRA